MQIQSEVSTLTPRAFGATPNIPGGLYGEQLVSQLMPDIYRLTKAGLVYTLTSAATNPTAFTGGAAGTPLFGIYNPTTSGVDLVILQARIAIRGTGTGAASSALNFWGVAQGGTAPTGTQSQARNMLTMAASGSQAYCMTNTANTGALATALIAPSIGITAVATTQTQQVSQLRDDVNGLIVVTPGNYLAYGIAAALTSGSIDGGLLWAEIPRV